MRAILVTVRLPRNPNHDPHNKITGNCPANLGSICTDSTGEHHTIRVEANTFAEARQFVVETLGFKHITRMEEINALYSPA